MRMAEGDWKRLRDLKPVALERLCERAPDELRQTASGRGTSHERYLRVFDLVRMRDKEMARAFDDLRRSNALPKLGEMRRLRLLTDDEFERCSDQTRATVALML